MKVQLSIAGDRELLKAMEELKASGVRSVARKGVTKALTPILRDAKAHVPKRTKTLRKSLGRRMKTYSRTGVVFGVVGPRKGFRDEHGNDPVKYAHLVENGTKPHIIRPQPGKRSLVIGEPGPDGKPRYAAVVSHPGTKAAHFLRRAYESNKTRALDIFSQTCREEVPKEVAKARAKAAAKAAAKAGGA